MFVPKLVGTGYILWVRASRVSYVSDAAYADSYNTSCYIASPSRVPNSLAVNIMVTQLIFRTRRYYELCRQSGRFSILIPEQKTSATTGDHVAMYVAMGTGALDERTMRWELTLSLAPISFPLYYAWALGGRERDTGWYGLGLHNCQFRVYMDRTIRIPLFSTWSFCSFCRLRARGMLVPFCTAELPTTDFLWN